MLHTSLFTRSRFLLLSISIISLFFFAAHTFAQEEVVRESSAYNAVIAGQPMVTEVEGGRYTLSFSLQNNDPENATDVAYGVALTEASGTAEILVGATGGGEITLAPGTSEQVTLSYEMPTWLSGAYRLYATLYAINGERLDSELIEEIELVETKALDVEIIRDSCLYNYADDSKTSFDNPLDIPENRMVSISCAVANYTENEVAVTPRINMQSPALVGGSAYVRENAEVLVPAQSVTSVTFEFPEVQSTGLYGVRLNVDGRFISNDVIGEGLFYSAPIRVVEESHAATSKEQNTVLMIVLMLLSLTILLAVLVYMRKSKESLQDMHYPEN